MWARFSHTLENLTKITPSKVIFKQNKIEQDAFDGIKQIVACDILLAYAYLTKYFKTHTNASKFRLGSIIIEDGKPIASYGRKITGSQMRYMAT